MLLGIVPTIARYVWRGTGMQATELLPCGKCKGEGECEIWAPFDNQVPLFGTCDECGGSGEDYDSTFPYYWAWGKFPQTELRVQEPWQNLRKGQRCRVLARGSMNSRLIEFEDGYRMVSSGNGLRRA